MSKHAPVQTDAFNRPASALDKLTGRTSAEPAEDNNAPPPPTAAVPPQSDPSTMREKVPFYLRPDQLDKLDELALAYRKHTGQRLNRNDIIRQLVDQCDLDMLLTAQKAIENRKR
jgi:hypothetical protein